MNKTVTHNLTTLLRVGAFEDTQDANLYAMSPHKWRMLIKASEELGIKPYIARAAQMIEQGITPLGEGHAPVCADNLSPELLKLDTEVEEFDTSAAHLFNIITQRNLDAVREEERYTRGAARNTLRLLDLIVANADTIITDDVSIEGIVTLGAFIRAHHDTIDFDKLNLWLARIGLVQVASLEGSMLISCMGFTRDELPFVRRTKKKSRDLFMNPIHKAFSPHSFSNMVRLDVAMLETISHRFMAAISLVTDIEE